VICGHGRAPRLRLRELGLVAGTRVTVVRRAPLGDPIEIELRGYRLCVRRDELRGLCAESPGTDP